MIPKQQRPHHPQSPNMQPTSSCGLTMRSSTTSSRKLLIELSPTHTTSLLWHRPMRLWQSFHPRYFFDLYDRYGTVMQADIKCIDAQGFGNGGTFGQGAGRKRPSGERKFHAGSPMRIASPEAAERYIAAMASVTRAPFSPSSVTANAAPCMAKRTPWCWPRPKPRWPPASK